MVLVKVLVLERHVAVVDGHGQLALAEQPLLSQVVVDLVPGLHKMVRLAVTVKILGVVNSTNIQHVLDALARIPCPLPSKKLHHKRGRTTPHAITPHQKAGQVSPTNTVLTQSQQGRGVNPTVARVHPPHTTSHSSHSSHCHGHHHGVHATGITA